MSKNYLYTVRTISVNDDQAHSCTGRIVAVLGSTRNVDRWYLTVLVERNAGDVDG